MTRASEFRAVLRRGRRVSSRDAVVHVLDHGVGPTRFGFIVAKTVGGAVTRNLVKRRLRSTCRGLLPALGDGKDVVIRALPGIVDRSWQEFETSIAASVRRAAA